jgi:hypothetical protein
MTGSLWGRLARETRKPLECSWFVWRHWPCAANKEGIEWVITASLFQCRCHELQFKCFRKQQTQTIKNDLFSEYNIYISLLQEFVKCKKFVHYLATRTEEKEETLWDLTLVDLQLDAQNFYLFTYNPFIKILYMFWALRFSSSGGLRRNCIYTASGIVTL